MLKREVNTIILLGTMFFYALIRCFLIESEFGPFIDASFILFLTYVSFFLLGYSRDKMNSLKKGVLKVTVILLIIYFTLLILLGLMIGFEKNVSFLSFSSVLNLVFAPIIQIICIELLRYIFVRANRDSIHRIVLIAIMFSIFEILLSYQFSSSLIELIFVLILPIITKEAVLTYFTYQVGYRPALIYRLVMDVYFYVIPVIPSFHSYMKGVIGVTFPILLFVEGSRVIEQYYAGEHHWQFSFKWFDFLLCSFVISFVMLTSGNFRYYVMGVGSGSMEPVLWKGDAILLDRKGTSTIKEGSIIAYDNGNKIIIHRVISIEKKNNRIYYHTKGDSNIHEDELIVSKKNVKGVVLFRIPYLAYPSIYMKKLLGG